MGASTRISQQDARHPGAELPGDLGVAAMGRVDLVDPVAGAPASPRVCRIKCDPAGVEHMHLADGSGVPRVLIEGQHQAAQPGEKIMHEALLHLQAADAVGQHGLVQPGVG
ncbi:hypothetical protein RZS08_28935, partial [Arthrospira platensis SPKY1]|nr:hypothetical protein [Arthrospira platensis SPKY1]